MNLQSKTDEELDVMLAKLNGWSEDEGLFFHTSRLTMARLASELPRYCSDLNEVARVEAGLTDEQHRDFRHHLMVIVIRETKGDQDRAFVSAKPRQRTIALISTLTKTP